MATRKTGLRGFSVDAHDVGGAGMLRSMERGGGHKSAISTEWVRLDSLKPDPENPRRLKMTMEKLLADRASLSEEDARAVEELRTLAASIKHGGLSNPIEVYPIPGAGFSIISGERRYWACMYNCETASNDDERIELSEVRVTIYKTKPQRLRLKQLSENRLRSDLSLADEMHSVFAAVDELEESERATAYSSVREMARMLHISNTDAHFWLKVQSRWPGLKPVIAAGKITSMWQLRKILALGEDQIAKLIPKIAQYGFSEDLLHEMPAPRKASEGERKPGRPRAPGHKIQARITETAGKRLAELVAAPLGLPDLLKVDWSKPREVTKAFTLIAEKLNG